MSYISIIIEIRNEIDLLADCLDALQQQTLPTSDFEVVVVANNPEESIRKLLSNYAKSLKLSLVETDSQNRGGAFNSGAKTASSDYYLFLRNGILPDLRFAKSHLLAQRDCGGGIIIGEVRLEYSRNAKGLMRYLVDWQNGHYKPLRHAQEIFWTLCETGNMSIPRHLFSSIGGFDESLPTAEDVEICFRLTQAKVPIIYSREASGCRKAIAGLGKIVLDIRKRAAAEINMYQRHPSMLPHLALGRFNDLGMRGSILRRFLFSLHVHPLLLAPFNLLPEKQSIGREWYRFFHSYCYWIGVRNALQNKETWESLSRGPIILMYHAIGHLHEPAGKYIIPEKQFKRQMAWLRKRDYRVISLEQLVSIRSEHRLPPGRSIIITFDDGYQDNWEVAYRILRHYGYPATIFLVSEFVGKANQWDQKGDLAGRPLLSWNQIREMRQEGFSFGAHSRSHSYLSGLSGDSLKNEVEGSHSDLQHQVEQPVLTFAYPNGKYNQEVISALKNAGFLAACSSDSGLNDPSVPDYALRRAEIRGNYSVIDFAFTLWLGQTRAFWRLLKGI